MYSGCDLDRRQSDSSLEGKKKKLSIKLGDASEAQVCHEDLLGRIHRCLQSTTGMKM